MNTINKDNIDIYINKNRYQLDDFDIQDKIIINEIIPTPEHRISKNWFSAAIKYKFNETIEQYNANLHIIQKLSNCEITQSDNMDEAVKKWASNKINEEVKDYRIMVNYQFLTLKKINM